MNRLQYARRQKLSWTGDESPDTELEGLLQLESRHNGPEPDAPRRQKRFRHLAIVGAVLLGAAGGACLLVEQHGLSQDAPGEIATMSLAEKLTESSLGSNSTQSGAFEAKANETPLLPAAPADVPAPVQVASVSATDLVSATPAPLAPITVAPPSTAAVPPAKKAPEPYFSSLGSPAHTCGDNHVSGRSRRSSVQSRSGPQERRSRGRTVVLRARGKCRRRPRGTRDGTDLRR